MFIALHGSGGEDGSIQGVLDFKNMPYTGSKVEASKLAISKYQSKKLWRQKGIKTADFCNFKIKTTIGLNHLRIWVEVSWLNQTQRLKFRHDSSIQPKTTSRCF